MNVNHNYEKYLYFKSPSSDIFESKEEETNPIFVETINESQSTINTSRTFISISDIISNSVNINNDDENILMIQFYQQLQKQQQQSAQLVKTSVITKIITSRGTTITKFKSSL